MARLFYPLLFLATFASAAALWSGKPDASQATAAMAAHGSDVPAGTVDQWSLPGGVTRPIPGPPTAPISPARPVTWPGTAADWPHPSPGGDPRPHAAQASPAPGIDAIHQSQNAPVPQPRPDVYPTSAHPTAHAPDEQAGQYRLPLTRLPEVHPAADHAGPSGPDAQGYGHVPPSWQVAIPDQRVPIPGYPELRQLEQTEILARVGSQVILAGEVLGYVEAILADNADKIPPGRENEIRQELIRKRLEPLIETKVVFQNIRDTLPPQGLDSIMKRVGEDFDRNELPRLMKRTKCETRAQLEERLNKVGSSIERKRQEFVEQMLTRQWIREKVSINEHVSHDELLEYYRENLESFARPARVRWQQLVLDISRYPSEREAWQQLAHLGNQIWAGASFDEIARQYSHGATASDGGHMDWTTKGSYISREVDQALFSLPVDALSPIIRDGRRLYIVRVLQREEAGHVPFVEAQVEIRDKIRDERIQQQTEQVLAELRQNTRVWTVFDDAARDDVLSESPRPRAPRPDGPTSRY